MCIGLHIGVFCRKNMKASQNSVHATDLRGCLRLSKQTFLKQVSATWRAMDKHDAVRSSRAFHKFTWKEAKGRRGDWAQLHSWQREESRVALWLLQKSAVSLSQLCSCARSEQRKSSRACGGSAASFQVLDTLKHPEFARRFYWK